MSWGYRCGTRSIAQSLQSKKELINTTKLGTKIYKSVIGNGICQVTVFWHDNRNTNLSSHLIIKDYFGSKHFDISGLRTQKEIFTFAENNIKNG